MTIAGTQFACMKAIIKYFDYTHGYKREDLSLFFEVLIYINLLGGVLCLYLSTMIEKNQPILVIFTVITFFTTILLWYVGSSLRENKPLTELTNKITLPLIVLLFIVGLSAVFYQTTFSCNAVYSYCDYKNISEKIWENHKKWQENIDGYFKK